MPLQDHLKEKILNANDYLNLNSAGIFDVDIDELCSLIHQNSSITFIALFDNNIGDRGAVILAAKLPLTVKIINLRRNNVSDEGAIALISNSQFESLIFRQSGDEITEKTGEAILKSTSLLRINLDQTKLSENLGMMARIEERLAENNALKIKMEISNSEVMQSTHKKTNKGTSIIAMVNSGFTSTIVRSVKANKVSNNENGNGPKT